MRDARVQSADGVRLAADCYGANNEKTIVFVHGWSLSKEVWRPQIALLKDRFRIITFDLRGHGASDRPEDLQAYKGRHTHARDIEAVLDHFNVDRAIIAGSSLGGVLASDAAVHLGAARAPGLVVISGSIESGTELVRESFGPLTDETRAMASGPRGPEEAKAVRRFLVDSRVKGAWEPAVFNQLFDIVMSMSPEQRRAVVARDVSYSNAEHLNEIGTATLLIHGKLDPVFLTRSSRVAHEDLTNSTLTIYDDAGHWPMAENPARFAGDIARFADRSLGQ